MPRHLPDSSAVLAVLVERKDLQLGGEIDLNNVACYSMCCSRFCGAHWWPTQVRSLAWFSAPTKAT